MKSKHVFLLAMTMVFSIACSTLLETGRIIARPALTILVQQLVSDSAEWGTVIRIVNGILDEALATSPAPTTAVVEASIDRLLGSHLPGTEEQRKYFMAEVSAALAEGNLMAASIRSERPTGLLIAKKSIDEGLEIQRE